MNLKRYFLTAFIALYGLTVTAANFRNTEFKNEGTDTTLITNILIDVDKMGIENPGTLTVEIARRLEGRPYKYKSGDIKSTEEVLRVNMEEFDCTTFVETVLALTITLQENRTSWRDFVYNLERIRYRDGNINGYASRLHYVSDWIVDNSHRGIIEEVTSKIVQRPDYTVKTIDYMTSHRDKYKALEDSTNYAQIKQTEMGYRSHRFPYIKSMNVNNAALKEGDIIAITSSLKDLDVMHMGIITIKDGTPHMIHASSKAGKVICDPLPLAEYLRKNRRATGIRAIRLTN